MNHLLIFIFSTLFVISCKTKKPKPEVPAADFFPVKSYLQGQLAQLDTSSSSFYKVETIDGFSDTTTIRNSDVKGYAGSFTNIPDISAADTKNDYTIDHLYDDMLEAFVFTFTTKESHPIKREDVVLDPQLNDQGKNDIKSVFIQMDEMRKDTLVQKNLLWEANKNFRIITTIEAPNLPAQTKTIQVFWNAVNSKNK
jgi:hypothetical protein